ncbi:hypothetical protein [Streptomyces sp. NPDC006551]|uniref:hypothetical protein n=1 Tax=Streptomyces sp. NPDC006551 TaxID=3157178 RepID=UPI0033B634D8
MATALAAAVLTVLATTPGTARAHGGTLAVDIAGHDHGRVTAQVTWENDKDSVDERVAATVNAVSVDGGRTEGPWILVRDPSDEKRFTTAEALPPGRWKVSVEVGHPALGRDEADITVPAAERTKTSPAPPAPAPHRPTVTTTPRPTVTTTPRPTGTTVAAEAPSWLPGTAAAAGGVLLAGGSAAFLVVRNKRRGRT